MENHRFRKHFVKKNKKNLVKPWFCSFQAHRIWWGGFWMGENQEKPGKPQVLPGFLVQKPRKTLKTTGFVSILSKKQEKRVKPWFCSF